MTQLAQQGQTSADRLLLGFLVATERIAPYAIAASLAQRARLLCLAVVGPFFPAAAQGYAEEGTFGLARITTSFSRRVALLLAAGTATGVFVARALLTRWVGETYAREG